MGDDGVLVVADLARIPGYVIPSRQLISSMNPGPYATHHPSGGQRTGRPRVHSGVQQGFAPDSELVGAAVGHGFRRLIGLTEGSVLRRVLAHADRNVVVQTVHSANIEYGSFCVCEIGIIRRGSRLGPRAPPSCSPQFSSS